eukprot:c10051_g1_i1 orf=1-198(-)
MALIVRPLNRALIGPILMLSFVLYIIVLGIAGWAINAYMDTTLLDQNEASIYFVIFALIAGVVGLA